MDKPEAAPPVANHPAHGETPEIEEVRSFERRGGTTPRESTRRHRERAGGDRSGTKGESASTDLSGDQT